MAISSLVTFLVREGGQSEQVEDLKAVKRLVERGWGTFRVFRQLFGSQVNYLVVVSEYKDWKGFAKVRSDPEFSHLVERVRGSANPAADLVGGEVYVELTIFAAYVLKSLSVFIAAYRMGLARRGKRESV